MRSPDVLGQWGYLILVNPLGKIEGRRRRGWQDEMAGWHHWLNGHEFEQASGVGDGQESLACCSPRGHKELDMTDRLNWTDETSNQKFVSFIIFFKTKQNKTISPFSISLLSSTSVLLIEIILVNRRYFCFILTFFYFLWAYSLVLSKFFGADHYLFLFWYFFSLICAF